MTKKVQKFGFVSPRTKDDIDRDFRGQNHSSVIKFYVPLWEDCEFKGFLEHYNIKSDILLPGFKNLICLKLRDVYGEEWRKFTIKEVFGNNPKIFINYGEYSVQKDMENSLGGLDYIDLSDYMLLENHGSILNRKQIKSHILFQYKSSFPYTEHTICFTDIMRNVIKNEVDKIDIENIKSSLQKMVFSYEDGQAAGIFFERLIKKVVVGENFNTIIEEVDKKFNTQYVSFKNRYTFKRCLYNDNVFSNNDSQKYRLEDSHAHFPFINVNSEGFDLLVLRKMDIDYNGIKKNITCILSLQVTIAESHRFCKEGIKNLVERAEFMYNIVDSKSKSNEIKSINNKCMLPIIHIFVVPKFNYVYQNFKVTNTRGEGNVVNLINANNIQIAKMYYNFYNDGYDT
jgi:hypothetical protein